MERQAKLRFWHNVEELWILEQSPAFINGFLAAALLWVRDQEEEEYYFEAQHNGLIVPISNVYHLYENTDNTTFYASFRPYKTLTSLLESETQAGYYGILISTVDDLARDYVIGLQSPSLDFVQGLLSAIDTFNLHYVLRYMIYRDGTYYNIPGRNLIIPAD